MDNHRVLRKEEKEEKKEIIRKDAVMAEERALPWMNLATFFRIRGTPWLWEYAPIEPISSDNSFARSTTSFGKALGAIFANSGHSMRAAT